MFRGLAGLINIVLDIIVSIGGLQHKLFFIIGPLRTGSSLMARCMDDHPAVICLCESEITRALFTDYYLKLHMRRMIAHGLNRDEVISYLDRKKQDDLFSLIAWYTEVVPRLSTLYDKPVVLAVGDKTPDFYRTPVLVRHLISHHRLIYTVRDPRAILASIEAQTDQSERDRVNRWKSLAQNYITWKPFLEHPNVIVTRYEDLLRGPESTMANVYEHVGLIHSPRFLRDFPRVAPRRFLWNTAVDYETGAAKEFDPSRIDTWRNSLTKSQLDRVARDKTMAEFIERFGYER